VTIDDGPDAAGTAALLEVLADEEARATFFVLASRAARDVGLLRGIAEAGHRIGNHGWQHLDAWRESDAVRDLERGERWLQDALGYEVTDVRPPFGHLAPATYRWARRGGRRVILWDAMPGDYDPSVSPARLAARVTRRVRAGSIAVLHDGPAAERASAAMSMFLPRLRNAGWRFPAL
jgi:peptidoglycan/xylan/chitin deacetylase (PgdA/CDA1 family)